MDPSEVKRKYRDALMKLPNVVGVGVGPKRASGTVTVPLAIKVYVSVKIPAGRLAVEDRIPSQLDGIPTDVEVQAPMRAR